MRVGFDARWYNDSGVGSYVAGLLRALAAAERRLELVVYVDPDNPVPELERLPLQTVPVRARKYSLVEQTELRRRARQDQLDLFHSPFFAAPLALGCPLVITVHDLIPFLFRIDPWPKQELVKLGYRLATRRAQHLIAVSRSTAADIERLLGVRDDRVSCVYNAVREDRFCAREDAGELAALAARHGVRLPYVVAASTRNWRTKNLSAALEAIALARESTGTNFQTVVYGPPDGLDRLACEGTPRPMNLLATGFLPQASLAALFRHASAFVVPSLYEGFGLPLLEAMSCGCPVVASNRGSLPEIAGGAAQLFDPREIKGMGNAVAGLLGDPTAAAAWKSRALARAAGFSWAAAARDTIAVYERAISSPVRPRAAPLPERA